MGSEMCIRDRLRPDPQLESELHPSVKAAYSSVEQNKRPDNFAVPPLHLPIVTEESFAGIEHSIDGNAIERQSSFSNSLAFNQQSKLTNSESGDQNYMVHRASDSMFLYTHEENLRAQQYSSNDAFETDLIETDVSPSILPSQEDL